MIVSFTLLTSKNTTTLLVIYYMIGVIVYWIPVLCSMVWFSPKPIIPSLYFLYAAILRKRSHLEQWDKSKLPSRERCTHIWWHTHGLCSLRYKSMQPLWVTGWSQWFKTYHRIVNLGHQSFVSGLQAEEWYCGGWGFMCRIYIWTFQKSSNWSWGEKQNIMKFGICVLS